MNRWLVNSIVKSPNFNERKLPISMVVLHYTGMKSAAEALERMCDPEAEVSAHYMIDEAGAVTSLVPEEKRAWHAGRSYWRGVTDVNSASIGIELVNPGHEWGYRPFPEAQMEALLPLLADIVKRNHIPRGNVVGHSDIAPARKQDPGEFFDWARLGDLGLALKIPLAKMNLFYDNPGAFYLALERFGYDISDGRAAVTAFQRRWRPELIDGQIDGEIGAILLELLLEQGSGRAR
ncbi:N-acetylmuramoyl-L-alanine amidase [Novosphingobium sp. PhB57]|jgi:N-acetylmuramoyl-L-alanine amidase|uniref:N-acetylmuramoyl-L-alanine amidase n=1 Tax=unclassified Novosphingobium TaxID=2644732 RepID=UPI001053F50A|nr:MULTISPECIES: N-acetylmuramoyl-L-alanine amidase [unclassified Novosphingobium]TCU61878.1 N-acetylmuramoyl-L-alanine amidase [Novosphingobium sp. PhB57]TDW68946.1 N-acetylmuramoyl-L-alanine amidase [Novosphingobium sp. PhB55]